MPEGWAWCRLPEICVIPITDGTHQTPTYSDKENGVPFLSSKDVTSGKIDWSKIKYITKELHQELQKRIAPKKDDILLAKNGTTGVAAIVEDETIFDIYVTLAVIRPNQKIVYPKFLLNIINSPFCKNQFNEHLTGIGVPNLHLVDINKTFVPLPPLNEQRQITDKIGSYTVHIDELEKNKSDLQTAIKQTKSKILDLAIHGKLVPQEPNDEPAEVLLKRIATSDNRPYKKFDGEEPFDIPALWSWCRLGEICDYGKCINVNSSDLKADDWILDLEDIEKDSGRIIAFHNFGERKSESTKHKFLKGQVLYSKLRPYLNKVVIAPKDGFCTSEILPLDFKSILLPRYAQVLLMSSYFLEMVNMVTYGVKMPRLGTNDAKNMQIPVPPRTEQQRIVSKIEELFSYLDTISSNLD